MTVPQEDASPLLGIVIPTLNEEEALPLLLSDLSGLSVPHRVVVADGGSLDGSRAVAERAGAEVVDAARGRASQMNAGAQALWTPWLLFLHADVRLSGDALQALERWLETASPAELGHFGFALDGRRWFWRFIELGQWII